MFRKPSCNRNFQTDINLNFIKIMNELIEQNSILERSLDTLRDPAVPKYAKIATIGLVVVAAVVYVGKTTIDAMGKCD